MIGRADPVHQNDNSLPFSVLRTITISNNTFGSVPSFWNSGNGPHYDVFVISDEAFPAGAAISADDNRTLEGFLKQVGEDTWVYPRGTWSLFQPQIITINGQRVYTDDQSGSYVIHGTDVAELDGKTNSQISAAYGLAVGDQIMPAGATDQGLGFTIFGAKVGPMISPRPLFYAFLIPISNGVMTAWVFDSESNALLSSTPVAVSKTPGYHWVILSGIVDKAGNRALRYLLL